MVTIEEIFCLVDDFCKIHQGNNREQSKKLLTQNKANAKLTRHRKSRLSESEIITILIYYQYSKFRNFKAYYLRHVSTQLSSEFPGLVSYTRFIELIPRIFFMLLSLLNSCLSKSTGIAFIDSTELPVCHKKRIRYHKVFQNIAALGKSSKGWFLGFKLHVLINHDGGLIAAKITPGNVDDRTPVLEMAQHLVGKLFGDKGYISKQLSHDLLKIGISLVTSVKKNMKPQVMSLFDKLVLKKRPVIESVNNQLKNVFQVGLVCT